MTPAIESDAAVRQQAANMLEAVGSLEAQMRQHALSHGLIGQGILLPWCNRLAKILDGDTFQADGTVVAGNMMMKRPSREE